MKSIVKYAAVGLAGYLVGFYEMKYKVLKAIADKYVTQEKNDSEEEKEEEA